jgi:aryl-alcohol dehydrogenase-like predicted oxidoreductase
VEKLEVFCTARGKTLLQLAFSWLLSKPVTGSVIAGATKPEQIDQNIAAAGWTLNQDELAEVEKILGPV